MSAAAGIEAPAPIRVVVADDSQAIRTLIRHTLSERRGFRIVAEAADGSEALALVEIHRPDCVVLDIEMPGMNGFEVLADLRFHAFEMPVIMLSGNDDAAVAEDAIKRGAAAHLDKTGQFVLLAETVRRVVEDVGDDAGTQPDRQPLPAAGDDASPASEASRLDPTPSAVALTAELRRLEYVVSHDLGEPLRIMTGFSTLLESRYGEALDETGTSFVRHISEASRRMQLMLADLLTYSRAGHVVPREDEVELTGLVEGLFVELAGRLTEHGVLASVDELPTVVGDADLMQVILRHLVVNAITFTTAAVPTVRVTGRVDSGSAVITVADNGIGMDAGQRERACDLFQRFNTREQYPGTGTGLALCRRLVTLQHGTLTLHPAPDGGSIATLTLPAGRPRSEPATPTQRSPR